MLEDIDIEEKKLEATRKTIDELADLYSRSDQAIFHILQKFDSLARDVVNYLDEESKDKFHERYEFLSGYLRHYRLGDDCLEKFEC